MVTTGDRAAQLLWERFCHRTDDYAVQWPSGHYTRAQAPLTPEVLRAHVAGQPTVGVYQVREDTVRWLCLDLDGAHGNPETCREAVRALLRTAVHFGLSPLPEPSGGKGWHVWLLTEEIPALLARQVAGGLLAETGPDALAGPHHIEVFPKQLGTGPDKPFGNLVKLPFGVHRVSGVRGHFVHPRTLDLLSPPDQIAVLERCPTHAGDLLAELVRGHGWQEPAKPAPAPPGAPAADNRIPDGLRNNTLTSLAGSMRQRGMEEEEILAALFAVNARRCHPPLPEDEVRTIARSVARYAPQEATSWRVGAAPDAFTSIEPLQMVDSDPPRWVLTVRGQELQLANEEMIEFKRFKLVCVAQLHFMPTFPVSEDSNGKRLSVQATWEKEFLAPALERFQQEPRIIKVPEDASERGVIWQDIVSFLHGSPLGETQQEIESRTVVRTDDEYLFRGMSLRQWFRVNRGECPKPCILFEVVRQHQGTAVSIRTQKGVVKVWRIPVQAVTDRGSHEGYTPAATE